MLITAIFDHPQFVELAVIELTEKGIRKDKILAIPLGQVQRDFAILDTIHRADGVSILDAAGVTATMGMGLGVIYGFICYWGPIIWGLIGLIIGSAIGLMYDYIATKRKRNKQQQNKRYELVIIVSCEKVQSDLVEEVLRNHTAVGVGKVMA